MTARSLNYWLNASTASNATPPSEWDQAANKPIDDYLQDLYSDEELEARKKRRTIFPFLELPREVRDEIYHHAWSSIVFGFHHENVLIVVRYGNHSIPETLAVFPRWLQAHPQIADEAMQQLHRCAVFSVVGHSETPLPFWSTSPQQWTIRAGAGTIVITPEIIQNPSHRLSLAEAAKVQVWGDSVTRKYTRGSCSLCTYDMRVQEETRNVLLAALSVRGNGDDGLSELDLTLTPPDFFKDPNERVPVANVHWDFSLFDKLPRTLKRLKIRIYNYRCWRHHSRSVYELVKTRVHSECLERVKALMQELPENRGAVEFAHGLEPCNDPDVEKTWFCEAVLVHYKRAMD